MRSLLLAGTALAVLASTPAVSSADTVEPFHRSTMLEALDCKATAVAGSGDSVALGRTKTFYLLDTERKITVDIYAKNGRSPLKSVVVFDSTQSGGKRQINDRTRQLNSDSRGRVKFKIKVNDLKPGVYRIGYRGTDRGDVRRTETSTNRCLVTVKAPAPALAPPPSHMQQAPALAPPPSHMQAPALAPPPPTSPAASTPSDPGVRLDCPLVVGGGLRHVTGTVGGGTQLPEGGWFLRYEWHTSTGVSFWDGEAYSSNDGRFSIGVDAPIPGPGQSYTMRLKVMRIPDGATSVCDYTVSTPMPR